jgi:hypothetical protein
MAARKAPAKDSEMQPSSGGDAPASRQQSTNEATLSLSVPKPGDPQVVAAPGDQPVAKTKNARKRAAGLPAGVERATLARKRKKQPSAADRKQVVEPQIDNVVSQRQAGDGPAPSQAGSTGSATTDVVPKGRLGRAAPTRNQPRAGTKTGARRRVRTPALVSRPNIGIREIRPVPFDNPNSYLFT